jgi:uncharacterized membrane protein
VPSSQPERTDVTCSCRVKHGAVVLSSSGGSKLLGPVPIVFTAATVKQYVMPNVRFLMMAIVLADPVLAEVCATHPDVNPSVALHVYTVTT